MSSFVGEGEGEYVLRFYTLVDEMEDLFSYYPGFTGSGAGED